MNTVPSPPLLPRHGITYGYKISMFSLPPSFLLALCPRGRCTNGKQPTIRPLTKRLCFSFYSPPLHLRNLFAQTKQTIELNWLQVDPLFFLRGVPPLFFRHSSKPSRSQVQILWTDKSSRDSIRTLVQRRGGSREGKGLFHLVAARHTFPTPPFTFVFVCFLVMKQADNAIEQINKIFDQEEGEHAGQQDNREQQNEHPIVHSSNNLFFFVLSVITEYLQNPC
ncbi:hypothetical protein BKA57DRAFT_281341 [Linnemannia elongata]|nr:hypothetical protein BKA57DRAFT_281341 [Linnemannia elongata]